MSMRTSVLAGLIGLAFAFGAFGATPEGAREVPMRWRGPEPEEPAEPEPPDRGRRGRRHVPFLPIVDGRVLFLDDHDFDFDDFHFDDDDFDFDDLEDMGFRRRRRARRLFLGDDFHRGRRRNVLVVVSPRDVPGTTYYYQRFPQYYAQPGYFPGVVREGSRVTIDSPTVRQQRRQQEERARQQAEQAAEQARETLERAAEGSFGSSLAPMFGGRERVPLHFAVGELKLKRGNFPAAAESLRRAVSAHPERPAAKMALGLALLGVEDYEAAAHILKRGLRGMADWGELNLDPAQAYGSADAAEVVFARLGEAAEKQPESEQLQFLLGARYFMTGEFGRAAEHMEKADLSDPLVEGLLQSARQRAEREGD
jgi:hypothetical protein